MAQCTVVSRCLQNSHNIRIAGYSFSTVTLMLFDVLGDLYTINEQVFLNLG